MDDRQTRNTIDQAAISELRKRGLAARILHRLVALPVDLLAVVGRAAFYCTWHLLYYIGCAFRAFTAFMLLGAAVMMLMTVAVLVKPDAAPMPFWSFPLTSIVLIVLAVGYNVLLDRFAPPGAEDPFDVYRRRSTKR